MKRTPLRKVSKKYRRELEIFNKSTKPLWLELHPYCQFKRENGTMCPETYGCTVHHKMRRGKHLNDMQYFMTVCPRHHDWIEANKRKARAEGYILYQ